MIVLTARQDKYGLVTVQHGKSTHTFPRADAAEGLKHLALSSDVMDDLCCQLDETGKG
jgi:hypothetical protein